MRTIVQIALTAALAAVLFGQSTPLPNWWFSADSKSVLADPLFPTLPLTTRKQILSQIDPKFAKMKPADQDRFIWRAETDNLPRASTPKQIFTWKTTDPDCTSELLEVGWINQAITKRIKTHDLSVQAALERFSFLRAHVRIENGTPEAVPIKPQIFVLEPTNPRLKTIFFEYPSRVFYQFVDAALNYNLDYIPTERTTIRSGTTGPTVATIETPDPVVKQELKDARASTLSGAFNYTATIENRSLKEVLLAPGAFAEGDVWFESNDKVREVVLRIFLSDYAFDIPFSLPKR